VGRLFPEVSRLFPISWTIGIMVDSFYVRLPPTQAFPDERTFILLPPTTWPSFQFFTPISNSLVASETDAHTGMFNGSLNDGFYDLGLRTVEILRRAIDEAKHIDEDEQRKQNRRKSRTKSIVADGPA
jgi:hypothetical protein